MNKREAATLLHISPRTLERRVKAGRYTCTRAGEGQYAEVSFSYADIGLSEPAPVIIPLAISHPAPHRAAQEPEQGESEPSVPDVIWVESIDPSKDIGFSGPDAGKRADEYRQQVAKAKLPPYVMLYGRSR